MAAARTYAALLRGVNVGGRNSLPMAGLRELCGELGYEDAVTYVQSGNAVFRSTRAPAAIAGELERGIAKSFGLTTRAILRTHAELERIRDGDPFGDGAGPVHVLFLGKRPAASALARLDPNRSPGDEFHAAGREIYLRYPNGSGRSKLTLDYFERTLGVAGTARNWNTLLKLIELTSP